MTQLESIRLKKLQDVNCKQREFVRTSELKDTLVGHIQSNGTNDGIELYQTARGRLFYISPVTNGEQNFNPRTQFYTPIVML
jgi:hypothetical protein